jgi:hypothetical protein
MKKFLLVLAAIALISLPIVMNSCDEDNPVNCSADYLEVIIQGNKTCLEYKEDLEDFIDKDCDTYDGVVQGLIDALDC